MSEIKICAPSRIYEDYPGGRFSRAAAVDYFERVGIGAMDLSFESLSSFDGSWQPVLYSMARLARAKGIDLPVCHLSFYMPSPFDQGLMERYRRELLFGIDAAALMNIPLAVVHPIALYSKDVKYGDFIRANIAFLSPVVEYSRKKGVKLCIENMPSEREAADNHLYGSCALNVSMLAEKLGTGICWDVGHANISGYKQSEQMEILKGKIDVLHIHDNSGKGGKDAHLLPFDGTVDWEDVAFGMRCCDFSGILDVEVTAWALSPDSDIRLALGRRIVERAQRLLSIGKMI